MKRFSSAGFTLIELLVTVSIISFLSSIVAASTSVARARGEDARKVTQTKSVQTALALYYDAHGSMPPNYDCSGGSCTPVAARTKGVAYEMKNPSTPDEIESSLAYQESMNDLVEEGFLSAVPESPDGTNGYYDYGPGSLGAVFTTDLYFDPPQPWTYSQCIPAQPAALCVWTPTIIIGMITEDESVPPSTELCSFTNPNTGGTCNYERVHQADYSGNGVITNYSGDCNFSCTGLDGEYCSCSPY